MTVLKGLLIVALLHSFCDVTTASVLPAYIWPLSYIFNDTIAVTPPMTVHGGVKKMTSGGSGLQFDGESGWIEAGDFSGI